MLGLTAEIAPIHWIIAAVALAALELACRSFLLIWFVFSAVIVALVLAMLPDLSLIWQVVAFVGFGFGLVVLGLKAFDAAPVPQGAERLNGQDAIVLQFAKGEGYVEVNGIIWRARWPNGGQARPGEIAIVARLNGMILEVEPMPN